MALKLKILIASFLYSFAVLAQVNTVSYYKLINIYDYGTIKEITNSGQFINIKQNLCYDSDAKGNDIGNGKLYVDVSNTSGDHIFSGKSYHGTVKYIFSPDYSILTVEINPHYKYTYKKSTPPAGIITSTLIKNHSTSGNQNFYTGSPGGNITPSYNTSINSESTTSPGTTNSAGYWSPEERNKRKNDNLNRGAGEMCLSCHGSGKCSACNGTRVASGLGQTYVCKVCSDGLCRVCHGTGKNSWNR